MARQHTVSRKRRTRQHVIADLSIHHVEGFVLDQGHTVQRFDRDYGYDLFLSTYDEEGYVEPGLACIQLKAAESLQRVATDYVFDLDIRDYNLWMLEERPVILILYDASFRRAYWLHMQRYFGDDTKRRPKKGAKWVRVKVPSRQRLNRKAIATMRDLKSSPRLRIVGGES
jgi:hypothetical protein